ncbi:carboxypeptidase-like regulatory domain-containing protein, partial [Arthrospira platensis SPKY1]|nr:carboxypeptidase-like regulatory domain-containing protein [Arthrospira platensis SPKY1]
LQAQTRYTISGYVREKGSKELLPGVNVYLPEQRIGTTTNNYGFYSISLPPDTYTIQFSFVGYEIIEIQPTLSSDIMLDIELSGSVALSEVVVSAERLVRNTESNQMSMISLPVN